MPYLVLVVEGLLDQSHVARLANLGVREVVDRLRSVDCVQVGVPERLFALLSLEQQEERDPVELLIVRENNTSTLGGSIRVK